MLFSLSLDWFPLLPGHVVALVALVLIGAVAWGSWLLTRKLIPRRWVLALAALRGLAVVLFVLCLLQPAFSYLAHVAQPPQLLLLVDTSASMGQQVDQDGPSRLVVSIDELRHSAMLDELSRRFDVRPFAFDRLAIPVDAAELDQLQPRGTTTDYARSLLSASELATVDAAVGSGGLPARQVLLISDGHDHGPESLPAAAARLGAVVHVVVPQSAISSVVSAPSITRVQAASRVLLASETQFLVTIEHGPAPAPKCNLVLYEDGRQVLTQEVAVDANSKEQRIRVAYRPTEVGLKHYEFALVAGSDATDSAPEAKYGVNVQVVDDKIEILLLEDRWRWEFKFFKRVIEDDPSFNLSALLARGGGAFLQLGEPERRVNLGGFPQSRAELDWFDLIVLGDVRPSQWPTGLQGAVADAVVEGGKSLVVVAGPALGELAQSPELLSLLPVDLSPESATPIEGPLETVLTPDGVQSGLFADGDMPPPAELPLIDRIYPALRKRAGAAVLVEAAQKANAAGPLIVLAEHRVGRGRVLFVATDALWKWHTLTSPDEEGRTLYGKFWQQAVRALTPLRNTAHAGLWLAAERSRYETSEPVRIRVDAPVIGEHNRAELTALVVVADGRRLPIDLVPDPAAADAWQAEFDAAVPGRYRVSVSATDSGQVLAETSLAIEVTAARGEADDTGVDRAALAEIAHRTGGRLVDVDDPQSWPQPDRLSPPQVQVRRTVNLWENLSLVALLCLVLGCDWLIRLLRGYV